MSRYEFGMIGYVYKEELVCRILMKLMDFTSGYKHIRSFLHQRGYSGLRWCITITAVDGSVYLMYLSVYLWGIPVYHDRQLYGHANFFKSQDVFVIQHDPTWKQRNTNYCLWVTNRELLQAMIPILHGVIRDVTKDMPQNVIHCMTQYMTQGMTQRMARSMIHHMT